jgi:hypothetical protein
MMTNDLVPKNEEKIEPSGFIKSITEPLSQRGWPEWLVYLMAVAGFIYLLNPTAGIFELLPDNLPIVGNLDEGASVLLILAGMVEVAEGKKRRKSEKQQKPID